MRRDFFDDDGVRARSVRYFVSSRLATHERSSAAREASQAACPPLRLVGGTEVPTERRSRAPAFAPVVLRMPRGVSRTREAERQARRAREAEVDRLFRFARLELFVLEAEAGAFRLESGVVAGVTAGDARCSCCRCCCWIISGSGVMCPVASCCVATTFYEPSCCGALGEGLAGEVRPH